MSGSRPAVKSIQSRITFVHLEADQDHLVTARRSLTGCFDPYPSVCEMIQKLTDSDPLHYTGNSLCGTVRLKISSKQRH